MGSEMCIRDRDEDEIMLVNKAPQPRRDLVDPDSLLEGLEDLPNAAEELGPLVAPPSVLQKRSQEPVRRVWPIVYVHGACRGWWPQTRKSQRPCDQNPLDWTRFSERIRKDMTRDWLNRCESEKEETRVMSAHDQRWPALASAAAVTQLANHVSCLLYTSPSPRDS